MHKKALYTKSACNDIATVIHYLEGIYFVTSAGFTLIFCNNSGVIFKFTPRFPPLINRVSILNIELSAYIGIFALMPRGDVPPNSYPVHLWANSYGAGRTFFTPSILRNTLASIV